eukprot:CAMPEP_0116572278 /NCGR_PEP_ID=MMETSP0397-20121206/18079_1 /TAXON_ID=216820 /ORGANISM="Cyclophora tenuis, Strain ECT3854" /LENGTH=78 /DNA_ID=CAMNT_0004100573 /DNA_START=276 /DNA_END=509 /DNA_ORIENTATION=+
MDDGDADSSVLLKEPTGDGLRKVSSLPVNLIADALRFRSSVAASWDCPKTGKIQKQQLTQRATRMDINFVIMNFSTLQ